MSCSEACADDTNGQTCYICTQALHWKTKEGLVRGCACRGTAGFAHVSCLAEQAKILVAEAEENKLSSKVTTERWYRWGICSLCEQQYHGVVFCALGWACWKTYVGRPETNRIRGMAMNVLGNGLTAAEHYEKAASVEEAFLSMSRRVGASLEHMLITQGNLASTYARLGHLEKALSMERDVYSGRLRLVGEEHEHTLGAALNYALSLAQLKRFAEAKALFRKTIPVARRVCGESNDLTLRMGFIYAKALYKDPGATIDDLREAVTTLEEAAPHARRVLGGAHPTTVEVEQSLRTARAALGARSVCEAMAAMTPPGDA